MQNKETILTDVANMTTLYQMLLAEKFNLHCKYNLSNSYNEKAYWTGGEGLGVGTEISRKTYLPGKHKFPD